ncbi:DUF6441 family protein [Rhodobacter sp. KR11]|uniref:DUF6441 family protein n=1 Tax=Rhodobacter sp. KR11 TaxID=2974588 RepID=UPI0022214D71|nr:DUF6441 family protein [Rhodobacter sp. KR11]MCW1920820.1 DUF6441 family protein [Rhodobacter sp. KR11]
MRLSVTVQGDFVEIVSSSIPEGRRAVTKGVAAAADGLKTAWRGQIAAAGLGPNLARTIRNAVYPKGGTSLRAAAVVYSNASKVVDAFDQGALIQSKDGFWLAIPLPAAGTKGLGNKRITPLGWERRTGLRLRFVYRTRGPSLLVTEGRLNTKGRATASKSKTGRGLTTVPIFLLLPQVKLKKRLELAAAAKAAESRLPAFVLANWPERSA